MIDDILGLVILTVVTSLARGEPVTLLNVAATTGGALAFSGRSCWPGPSGSLDLAPRQSSTFPVRRRSWD